MTNFEMVRKFHEIFGFPIGIEPGFHEASIELRNELIREEAQEFYDAVEARDIVEAADALGDLLYVTYGAAVTMGIDLDKVFAEIHRSNLTKLGEDGKPIYREDGKAIKGPNFELPRIAEILGVTVDNRRR